MNPVFMGDGGDFLHSLALFVFGVVVIGLLVKIMKDDEDDSPK